VASSRPLRSRTDRSARLIVLRVCLVVCRLVCLSVCLCLHVCLSVGRSDGRTAGLSTCLSIYRPVCQSVSLPVCQLVAFLYVSRRLVGRSGGSGWRESRAVADGWACGRCVRVCPCPCLPILQEPCTSAWRSASEPQRPLLGCGRSSARSFNRRKASSWVGSYRLRV